MTAPKPKIRVTRKLINEFLWKYCYKTKVVIPPTKTSFRTIVGNHYIGIDYVKWLIRKGYTEQIGGLSDNHKNGTICVAYNPTEKKWMGWSHRASTTFHIGMEMPKNHINCTNKKN